jgi:hypothetical protein
MSSSLNPPPLNRPIRRRNPSPPPAPAASTAKISSSNIPSLTAVRRTLFHSSSASRLAARVPSQSTTNTGVEGGTNGNTLNNGVRAATTSTAMIGVAPHQMRREEEDFVYRDKDGKIVMEGALNMAHFPRDQQTEEESRMYVKGSTRNMITDGCLP